MGSGEEQTGPDHRVFGITLKSLYLRNKEEHFNNSTCMFFMFCNHSTNLRSAQASVHLARSGRGRVSRQSSVDSWKSEEGKQNILYIPKDPAIPGPVLFPSRCTARSETDFERGMKPCVPTVRTGILCMTLSENNFRFSISSGYLLHIISGNVISRTNSAGAGAAGFTVG